MSQVQVKRKRKVKNVQLTAKLKKFVLTHILTAEDDERGEALTVRYTVRAARLVAGAVFCALLCRSQLAFSVYPFGIIFLCAASRGLPLYSAVALISSLTIGGVSNIYAALCALILAARSVLCIYFDAKDEGVRRFPLYNEWVAYRVIVSCVASFIIGVYNLFYHGFTYYSLLGSLLLMAVCPIGTYVFCCGLDRGQRTEMRDVARLFLCAVLVWSVHGISLFGIDAGGVVTFCLVSNESTKNKEGAAALMGLVCGVPYGLSRCAIYAIGGMLGAALGSLSAFLGDLGLFTFTVMAEGYIGGYSALLSVLPATSVGLALMLAYKKFDVAQRLGVFAFPVMEGAEPIMRDARSGALKSIEEISHAFSSLATMLKGLSVGARRAHLLEPSVICEQSCDAVCTDCKKRHLCWEKDPATTADAFSKVSRVISEEGRVQPRTLGQYLETHCIKKDTLCEEINRRISGATEQCMKKTGTEVFAADYDAMAQILTSHLEKAKERESLDTELSERLMALCHKKLYGIGAVQVWGKRQKQIYATDIDLSAHTVSGAELRREFERICGCRLSSPVYSVDDSNIELEMHTCPALTVESAIATLTKEGERQSGDTADTLTNSEGYFYGILCDGMGSGKEAAYTSGVCCEYLHNMVYSANPKELTIEMLNAVIREGAQECSSTVDLFELDTYSGEGCFIKSGAAPSFVCRQKNVYRISAKTIPIGIVERIGAEKIKFRLRAGDIVVMVSDGVVEGAEEGRLVVEKLCRRTTDNPFDIAAAVLAAAKSKYSCRDDMTVVAITIGAKEE